MAISSWLELTQWITSTIGAITSAIIAGTAVVGFLHLKVVKPMKNWFAKVDRLLKELVPNGGSSLRDAIDKMAENLDHHIKVQRAIRNFGTACIYECDADGNCIHASKALCELFGLTPDEMMGNGWLAGVDERYRIPAYHHWKECVAQKVPYTNEYVVRNQKTHISTKIATMAKPIMDTSNKVISYIGEITIQD